MTAMSDRAAVFLALSLAVFGLSGCGGSPTGADSPVLNVQGNWGGGSSEVGTYQVSSCTDSGAIRTPGGFCLQTPVGTFAHIGLVLNQNGNHVTGTAYMGIYSIPISGTLQGSAMTLGGSATVSASGFSTLATATITGWNTTVSNNSMSGAFNLQITVPGYSGSGTWTAQILTLAKD